MFSKDNPWTNVAKMGQEEWYKMYVSPFLLRLELALAGIPVKGIDLPTGTFTWKCATGLHLLRLRSQCIFIPIERQRH